MARAKYAIFYFVCILVGVIFTACSSFSSRKEVTLIEAEKAEGSSETTILETNNEVVFVHICGAVQKPDVYEFPVGSRLKDAVVMAGGFTKKAEPERVNLARILVDGEQIVIPMKGEELLNESKGEEEKLDLNIATKEQLMELPGVGESKAEAILNYRMEKGGFQKIEEIKEISGIKDGVFQKFKDLIIVH